MVDNQAPPAPPTMTDIPVNRLRQLRGSTRKEGWGTSILSLEELEAFLHDLISSQMGESGGRPLISTPFEPRNEAEDLFLIVDVKRYDDPNASNWLYLSDVANLLDQTQLFLSTNFAGKNAAIINELIAQPDLRISAIRSIQVGDANTVSEQKAFDRRKELLRRAELLANAISLLREAQGEESLFKSAKAELIAYFRSHNLVTAQKRTP